MDKSFPTNRLQMTLAELRRASERTLIVRLKFADGETFMYRPGQFVGLEAPDGRPRYFSVANAIPVGNELELHVNRAPAGAFTGALFAEAQVGDQLWVEGPFGEFRIPPEAPNEIILVAGGTGFAPLRACLELLAADEKARPGAGRKSTFTGELAPWRTSTTSPAFWRSPSSCRVSASFPSWARVTRTSAPGRGWCTEPSSRISRICPTTTSSPADRQR